MYRVLLAVDTDEQRAKRAAQAVAGLPGDGEELEVVILNVFEEFESPGEIPVSSEELYEETDFPESVEVAREILETAGADTIERREHGDPTDRILAVAEEIDADSIAMSGRKRSATGKVLFGSVSQSVLLSADRPVLITMVD